MATHIIRLAALLLCSAPAFDMLSHAATSTSSESKTIQPAAPAEAHRVLGNQSCVKCHAPEIQVWKNTPHAKTFEQLHRSAEGKAIAAKLGLQSIKYSDRCIACHYTQQKTATGETHTIAGVSCESCHGAAKDWLELHHDYGGEGITRQNESPEHRQQRIARSVATGMRNPQNIYTVAQSCLRCHTAPDEELVNIGGHSAGSLDFEFVSWSQGLIRHNFVRSDGKSNTTSSPARLHLMFVAGMIAELEASLRATAMATTKATYGVTAAKRAARAGGRLQSVSEKIDSPQIDQIVDIFNSVQLRLNNQEPLNEAADQVARLGFEFAQTNQVDLSPLTPFIPTRDRYK